MKRIEGERNGWLEPKAGCLKISLSRPPPFPLLERPRYENRKIGT